jgi:hypothetical protein
LGTNTTFCHGYLLLGILKGPNLKTEARQRWVEYDKKECQWFPPGYGFFDYILEITTTELGQSVHLTTLDLNRNQLIGSILIELGTTILVFLGLADNHLYGTIPSHLSLLESLEQLQLQHNMLSRRLSGEQSSSIPRLNLGGNQSTGWVPEHLLNATAVWDFLLSSLTVCIS